MFIDTFIFDFGIYDPVIDPDTGEPVIDPDTGKPIEVLVRDAAFDTADDMIIASDLSVPNFEKIDVKNIIIDDLFGQTPPEEDDPTSWDGVIPTEWQWNTILHAKFNGNLFAGSIDYSAEITSEVRIKRRLKGEFDWTTIHVHEVTKSDDFRFTFIDMTNAGNTEYEYAFIPLIEGEEGDVTFRGVKSDFSSVFIFDTELTAQAVLNVELNQDYIQETSVVTTIGRKYPYIIKNGDVGYYSGTLSSTFMPLIRQMEIPVPGDEDKPEDEQRTELISCCEWDYMNGAKYRKIIDQFLTNGLPKIIKDWQGRMYLTNIIDTISQDGNGFPYLPIHNINWVEAGDATYVGDLYDNGFINTDMDR